MQHIIKKQQIYLSVDKKLDAFHLQQQMSELYRQEVLPLLEKLFDEAAEDGKTLYIDSLAVDLGVISEKELSSKRGKESFLQKVVKLCEEKLTVEASAHQPSMQTEHSPLSACRQWMFYMQKGYLPWNVLQLTPAWKQKVLEALAVDYASIEALRKLLKTNPRVVGRMVEQHSESFLLQLVSIMAAGKQTELPLLLNELTIVLQTTGKNSTTAGSRLRNQLWCRLLPLAAEHKEKLNNQLVGQRLLQEYLGHPTKLQVIKPKILNKLKVLLPLIREWKDELQKQEGSLLSVPENPASAHLEKGQQSIFNSPKEALASTGNTDSNLRNVETSIDEEGIFVVNAGIVLLHPFLSFFFNRLALLQEGKFLDKGSHQKALYLLHYLTTGVRDAEECELVIPKVLTDYPLEEPVEREVYLSMEETAEADHLLQEAIRQWEVLKSTSPDALRGEFLQRRAKLFTKNDSLYLHFEAAAIDVLLDQLPWNLSHIKLPWMKNMLRIEWR